MSNEDNELQTPETEEIAEFDERPAGSKDLWLFLIVLDIIVLCVFGFLIYKHFSTRVFEAKPTPSTEVVLKEEPEELVVVEKEVVAVVAPAPKETSVQPEPVKPAPVSQEPVSVEPVQEKPVVVAAEPKQEQHKINSPAQMPEENEGRESISIEYGKGKYHPVTFRWFGEGNKVAIVSGFTSSKPRALKKVDDHWEITLSIAPGTYKFLYVIDGKNRKDPYAPEQDGRSVLEVK